MLTSPVLGQGESQSRFQLPFKSRVRYRHTSYMYLTDLKMKRLQFLELRFMYLISYFKQVGTRAVLVFATERKNNVDPRLRSQKKVKNVQLFFAK